MLNIYVAIFCHFLCTGSHLITTRLLGLAPGRYLRTATIHLFGLASIIGVNTAGVMWLANRASAPTSFKRIQFTDQSRGHVFNDRSKGVNHLRPSPASPQTGSTKRKLQDAANSYVLLATTGTSPSRKTVLSTGNDPLPLDTVINAAAPAAEPYMIKKRKFEGQRLDFEQMAKEASVPSSGNVTGKEHECNKWAVLTTCSHVSAPRKVVKQMEMMNECVS